MYVFKYVCMYVSMCVCMQGRIMTFRAPSLQLTLAYRMIRHCMYWCMTTSMYCLYVGVDYTYIGINTLASQVWFQAVAGARTYGTDSPAITSQLR